MRLLNTNRHKTSNQLKQNKGVLASLVVTGHLEDSLHEIDYNLRSLIVENTTVRLRFIMHLVKELNGDLNQYIDPNAMYMNWITKFN